MLRDFRNYGEAQVEPGATLNVFTGPNGAGKTNLLEAASMLSPGRGLRNAAFESLARVGGSGQWTVAARIAGPGGEISLGTDWAAAEDADGRTGSRRVSIDGVMQKSSGPLGEYVAVLWLTPAMDRLFAGPAAERRRFFDRLVLAIDPSHGTRVSTYERLMRERNRLLQDPQPDRAWLDSVELQMVEAGTAIAAARRDAVLRLKPYLDQGSTLSGDPFPWAELALEGTVEGLLESNSAVQAEEHYRRMLADSRRLDATTGRTATGPHRSDLKVVHGPKSEPAETCSTGEQKALLVALVVAHARLVRGSGAGHPPILLLDEIAAHLDQRRREGLFALLHGLGCQVWMTGTDVGLFETIRNLASFFTVEVGRVERAA